jgi:hypothetical protein
MKKGLKIFRVVGKLVDRFAIIKRYNGLIIVDKEMPHLQHSEFDSLTGLHIQSGKHPEILEGDYTYEGWLQRYKIVYALFPHRSSLISMYLDTSPTCNYIFEAESFYVHFNSGVNWLGYEDKSNGSIRMDTKRIISHRIRFDNNTSEFEKAVNIYTTLISRLRIPSELLEKITHD